MSKNNDENRAKKSCKKIVQKNHDKKSSERKWKRDVSRGRPMGERSTATPSWPDLVEEAVEVDVQTVAVRRVQQDVLSVPVAQSEDVSHHAHDGRRPTVREARVVPARHQAALRNTPAKEAMNL